MSNGKGSKGRPKILSPPPAKPAVGQTPICALGQRCHVSGKGVKRFGTKFSRAMVQDLASSSVQLMGVHATTGKVTRLASGVLIAPQVVLCAAHSLSSFATGGIEFLMDFECDDKTAPAGMAAQYAGAPWPACTELAKTPQAVEVKTLESESPQNLDYALVLIRWKSVAPGNIVKLPKAPKIPRPGRTFTQELVVIGHPHDPADEGEPTQACAFKLFRTRGPNPQTGTGDTYVYGDFGFEKGEGFSGGGMFNEQGELVGIMKGSPGNTLTSKGLLKTHFAFLDLGLASDHTMNDPNRGRLKLWFETKDPLKPSDGAGKDPTFA